MGGDLSRSQLDLLDQMVKAEEAQPGNPFIVIELGNAPGTILAHQGWGKPLVNMADIRSMERRGVVEITNHNQSGKPLYAVTAEGRELIQQLGDHRVAAPTRVGSLHVSGVSPVSFKDAGGPPPTPLPDLEKSQVDLLVAMVESERASSQSHPFLMVTTSQGATLVHDELGVRGNLEIDPADARSLEEARLLRMVPSGPGTTAWEVTPAGRKAYASIREQQGAPVELVEMEVIRFLDAEVFRERHPGSCELIREAMTLYWASPNPDSTVIGHNCRNAMKAFASELVGACEVDDVDEDPAHTINRLQAVFRSLESDTNRSLLGALVGLWRATNDVAQRQEHERTSREDTRRTVFATAYTMYEIDRTVSP